jgi:hypothetical protein
MTRQSNSRHAGVWVVLTALVVFGIPFTVVALQHQPAPPVTDSTVEQPNARVEGGVPAEAVQEEIQINREKMTTDQRNDTVPCGETAAAMGNGPGQTEVVYHLGDMLNHAEDYLGKTITVDGEMHRQFTDKVFTIEDDGFIQDRDMLVISVSPMAESVIPLEGSFDRGKKVRVTGVLRPYDRGKLECLYGPLALESREGHSFTKNPVLIIGYKEPPKRAAANLPPIERSKSAAALPTLTPPAAPETVAPAAPAAPETAAGTPETPAPAAKEKPAELPRTAGELQLIGLTGGMSLLAASIIHFSGRRRRSR